MPLHDWTDRAGWEGVHHLWISELLRWTKPRLPEGYRAYVGSAPLLAVGLTSTKPDVAFLSSKPERSESTPPSSTASSVQEPDEEVAVATLDPDTAIFVERAGQLVAAIELISPRNKDRTIARASYLARYLGYLLDGVHLALVDVHPRPRGFSFANQLASELDLAQPHLDPPLAVSYRVGEPASTGGRMLAIWRRPMIVGAPIPDLPLPLDMTHSVGLDLEQTYARAAADAYID